MQRVTTISENIDTLGMFTKLYSAFTADDFQILLL